VATVLASHLLNHDFGIRIDVKCLGPEGQSTLQGFQESKAESLAEDISQAVDFRTVQQFVQRQVFAGTFPRTDLIRKNI